MAVRADHPWKTNAGWKRPHGSSMMNRTSAEGARRKLTATDYSTIKARYAAGSVTQAVLAAEYGVTTHTIWYVINK